MKKTSIILYAALSVTPAFAQVDIDAREMAAFSGEDYVHCLAYYAIRADDSVSSPRKLVTSVKDKCNVYWGMYKFFVRKDSSSRQKISESQMEAALGSLNEIAIDNATETTSSIIMSVRHQNVENVANQ